MNKLVFSLMIIFLSFSISAYALDLENVPVSEVAVSNGEVRVNFLTGEIMFPGKPPAPLAQQAILSIDPLNPHIFNITYNTLLTALANDLRVNVKLGDPKREILSVTLRRK